MKNAFQQIKVLSLVLIASGLSMGNEGCEEASVKQRVLKMDVEVGTLNARPVTLPTGEVIDFPYAVNSLFYRQVMDDDHFVILGPVPTPQLMTGYSHNQSQPFSLSQKADSSSNRVMNDDVTTVSESDLNVLSSFGFLDQLQDKAEAQRTDFGSFQSKSGVDASELPACLYDMPQARLGGAMISFEASWGVGVGIGYGRDGSVIGGDAAGSVDFSSSKLELGLLTEDPLTLEPVVISDGIARQSKTKFRVDFGGLPIGLSFIFNTPIADVIRNAMDNGLDKIVDRYKEMLSLNNHWDEVWESRVIYDPELVNNDTHVAFRGGYRAGIQIGDKFTVTNMRYVWEGAACYSRLRYKVPLTPTPLAELEVISLGDNVAVAKVVRYLADGRIDPGAMIKIQALKQPPPPAKKETKKKR